MSHSPLDEARRQLGRGNLEAAEQILDKIVLTAGEKQVAETWPMRLAIARGRGHPEVVFESGSRWARLARTRHWHGIHAHMLSLMGRSALDLSDYRRAQVWFEEALFSAEQSGDPSEQARALLGTAIAWELRGEPQRLLSVAEKALEKARQGSDPQTLAEALTAVGRGRLATRSPDAEAALSEAEQVLEDGDAQVLLIKCLLDHLVIPMSRGDLAASEMLLDRAESLLSVVQDASLNGRVSLDRGELLRLQGRPEEAILRYQHTIERVQVGHPFARAARLNLALTRLFEGQFDTVREEMPALLEVTSGHTFYQGVAHLVALGAGPKSMEEDEFWRLHGTPARLALTRAGGDSDIRRLAQLAARRMVDQADPIQAGRAALIAGIADELPSFLRNELRARRAAVPIGSFLTLNRIGAGGMGEVWLARHVDTDQPAALKVVRSTPENDNKALASFQIELKAVASLDHPNIVRLLDHGQAGRATSWVSQGRIQEGSPFLALEFVRGGTLSPWMGKLGWEQVVRVLVDLLRALAHAHARNVLHLDIKPDNVLLRSPGKPEDGVRLTDFGLALLRDQARKGVAGTLSFMAPEQLAADRLSPATDLYALGCLAWGMIHNVPPFQADDRTAMAALHEKGLPPSPSLPDGIPAAVDGWIRSLLVLDPSRRVSRAFDALRSLEAIAELPDAPDGRSTAPNTIAEGGLGLLDARKPRLVGHEAIRTALWNDLLTCRDTRRPRAIDLRGPRGCGRHALLDWFAAQAHEAGLAEVVRFTGPLADELGTKSTSPAAIAVRLAHHLNRVRAGRVALVLLDPQNDEVPRVVDILLREGEDPFLFAVSTPPSRLRRHRSVQAYEPDPLDDDELAEMAGSLLLLEPSFSKRLVSWCDGNAGLLTSCLHAWAASGELRPSRDGWSCPQMHQFRVPRRLARSIEGRLRDIADTPSRWEDLQLAAALGKRVPAETWSDLAHDVDDIAEALVDARVLEATPRGFAWQDPAARYVVAEQPTTRGAHSVIADHLKEAGRDPGRVADHLVAAQRHSDAHRPLLDSIRMHLDRGDRAAARERFSQWTSLMERLAVAAHDPRRLAGRRFARQLDG